MSVDTTCNPITHVFLLFKLGHCGKWSLLSFKAGGYIPKLFWLKSQDWNCFPPTEQGICSVPLELGARPGCCLQNEACVWALPSSHLLVFHGAGPAHPCHGSPSPCMSVVIWGTGLVGLMNGGRLPLYQGTGLGSLGDQTDPEAPPTPPVLLQTPLPFRGDPWQAAVLVLLAGMIHRSVFCLGKLFPKWQKRVTGAGCRLRSLGQKLTCVAVVWLELCMPSIALSVFVYVSAT